MILGKIGVYQIVDLNTSASIYEYAVRAVARRRKKAPRSQDYVILMWPYLARLRRGCTDE